MIDCKILFVSGKGGVGKSAMAASLALQAARLGRRVLAIGMAEGIGIAAHLGSDTLSYDAHRVRSGVDALAVNRSDALDEYLRLQLRVPRPAPTKLLSRALSVLAETAPGVREIITIGKPVFEMWQEGYDIVIVDAPPLGQLFSYLRAPSTIADLVPAGPIRIQAERMRAALEDPETARLLLVTTPDELPVLETMEALEQLDREQVIQLSGVVTNRVLPELALTSSQVAGLPSGAHRAAAEHHLGVQTQQERWIAELPNGPRFPYLFGIHTAGEVAETLADLWDDQL